MWNATQHIYKRNLLYCGKNIQIAFIIFLLVLRLLAGIDLRGQVMRTSIQLLHPQPLLLYILDQLLELVHAN